VVHRGSRFLVALLALAASVFGLPAAETATAAPPTLTGVGLVAGDQFPGTTLTVTCSASDPNTLTYSASGLATGVPSGSGPYPGTFAEQGTLTRDPTTGQVSFAATFEIRSLAGTVTGTKSAPSAGVGGIGCPASPTAYTAGGPFPASYTAQIQTEEGVFSDQGTTGVGMCFNCPFPDVLGESFTSEQACVVETVAASAPAEAAPSGRVDPAPVRRLRDRVLARSAGGRRYVALYEAHSPEVVRLMLADPALLGEVRDGLLVWQASLGALASGRGGAVTVSAEQVQAVERVLDRLTARGSPALRQAIERERRAHPPTGFVGRPLDRALAELTAT
jgi:hypothetical protein